jgi:hypothetical protein
MIEKEKNHDIIIVPNENTALLKKNVSRIITTTTVNGSTAIMYTHKHELYITIFLALCGLIFTLSGIFNVVSSQDVYYIFLYGVFCIVTGLVWTGILVFHQIFVIGI